MFINKCSKLTFSDKGRWKDKILCYANDINIMFIGSAIIKFMAEYFILTALF